ncbi:uncharacterized protein SPPG_01436 [Spizellomyces punctatus DAOM BR117]|uniref:NUDE domain-containing protein n=1 Tax=Spizellomyces punctatus (strain DAOM BR117) TaxID=645134 RepID=A0A0L0HS86_SPIPD|nr:uncharacterized protein SPPG_01436 [Spizellomyces punctatus DAOM BR117]KND03988.1 hypothetical protein SPPG_01436 [Spizellomyces punctatus DAOM BR117]|eukprot:XP_016612027.1 hypothetical protein SPPG_01436 [Spizellomyces punctatus DAOM BR117]
MTSASEDLDSTENQITQLREELQATKEELEDSKRMFDEFQQDSKDLEAELEREIEELRNGNAKLRKDYEDLKSKYASLQAQSNANINALQQELEQLRKTDADYRERIRNLEIQNSDIEQSFRVTSASADDFQSKYNQLMERTTLLEHELDGKAQLEEENQRLRDELRDTSMELSILKERAGVATPPGELRQRDNTEAASVPLGTPDLQSTQIRRPMTPSSPVPASSPKRPDPVPAETMRNLEALVSRAKALEERISAARNRYVVPLLRGLWPKQAGGPSSEPILQTKAVESLDFTSDVVEASNNSGAEETDSSAILNASNVPQNIETGTIHGKPAEEIVVSETPNQTEELVKTVQNEMGSPRATLVSTVAAPDTESDEDIGPVTTKKDAKPAEDTDMRHDASLSADNLNDHAAVDDEEKAELPVENIPYAADNLDRAERDTNPDDENLQLGKTEVYADMESEPAVHSGDPTSYEAEITEPEGATAIDGDDVPLDDSEEIVEKEADATVDHGIPALVEAEENLPVIDNLAIPMIAANDNVLVHVENRYEKAPVDDESVLPLVREKPVPYSENLESLGGETATDDAPLIDGERSVDEQAEGTIGMNHAVRSEPLGDGMVDASTRGIPDDVALGEDVPTKEKLITSPMVDVTEYGQPDYCSSTAAESTTDEAKPKDLYDQPMAEGSISPSLNLLDSDVSFEEKTLEVAQTDGEPLLHENAASNKAALNSERPVEVDRVTEVDTELRQSLPRNESADAATFELGGSSKIPSAFDGTGVIDVPSGETVIEDGPAQEVPEIAHAPESVPKEKQDTLPCREPVAFDDSVSRMDIGSDNGSLSVENELSELAHDIELMGGIVIEERLSVPRGLDSTALHDTELLFERSPSVAEDLVVYEPLETEITDTQSLEKSLWELQNAQVATSKTIDQTELPEFLVTLPADNSRTEILVDEPLPLIPSEIPCLDGEPGAPLTKPELTAIASQTDDPLGAHILEELPDVATEISPEVLSVDVEHAISVADTEPADAPKPDVFVENFVNLTHDPTLPKPAEGGLGSSACEDNGWADSSSEAQNIAQDLGTADQVAMGGAANPEQDSIFRQNPLSSEAGVQAIVSPESLDAFEGGETTTADTDVSMKVATDQETEGEAADQVPADEVDEEDHRIRRNSTTTSQTVDLQEGTETFTEAPADHARDGKQNSETLSAPQNKVDLPTSEAEVSAESLDDEPVSEDDVDLPASEAEVLAESLDSEPVFKDEAEGLAENQVAESLYSEPVSEDEINLPTSEAEVLAENQVAEPLDSEPLLEDEVDLSTSKAEAEIPDESQGGMSFDSEPAEEVTQDAEDLGDVPSTEDELDALDTTLEEHPVVAIDKVSKLQNDVNDETTAPEHCQAADFAASTANLETDMPINPATEEPLALDTFVEKVTKHEGSNDLKSPIHESFEQPERPIEEEEEVVRSGDLLSNAISIPAQKELANEPLPTQLDHIVSDPENQLHDEGLGPEEGNPREASGTDKDSASVTSESIHGDFVNVENVEKVPFLETSDECTDGSREPTKLSAMEEEVGQNDQVAVNHGGRGSASLVDALRDGEEEPIAKENHSPVS